MITGTIPLDKEYNLKEILNDCYKFIIKKKSNELFFIAIKNCRFTRTRNQIIIDNIRFDENPAEIIYDGAKLNRGNRLSYE